MKTNKFNTKEFVYGFVLGIIVTIIAIILIFILSGAVILFYIKRFFGLS